MRVLVFGCTGMLGHKLFQVLRQGFDVWGTTRCQLNGRWDLFTGANVVRSVDVQDASAVRNTLESVRPEVVINAVGIVKQLPVASNVISTLMTNSIFPHHLAEMSATYDFRLVSISTDCVFDGRKGNYAEGDAADALDLYGTSKRLGEVTDKNCLTLRTSIIGRELATTHSLVEWFISNRGEKVSGFVNAIYSGFPTIEFADIIIGLLLEHPRLDGLYHVSSDPISKYDLLRLINAKFRLNIDIVPAEEPRINRSLDSEKFRRITGYSPPSWDEMIERMAADTTPYDEWRRKKS